LYLIHKTKMPLLKLSSKLFQQANLRRSHLVSCSKENQM
jgi:hypothetical protein